MILSICILYATRGVPRIFLEARTLIFMDHYIKRKVMPHFEDLGFQVERQGDQRGQNKHLHAGPLCFQLRLSAIRRFGEQPAWQHEQVLVGDFAVEFVITRQAFLDGLVLDTDKQVSRLGILLYIVQPFMEVSRRRIQIC